MANSQHIQGVAYARLPSPLLSIREDVMERWEREVKARVVGAGQLRGPGMSQALSMLFDEIAVALSSRAGTRSLNASTDETPAAHGIDRARRTSFGPEQVAHEYHIFRESIAAVANGRVDITSRQWRQIDQAIDHATRQALKAFASVQEQARRKVAAALSHDMRTPLAVIANGAQVVDLTSNLETAKTAAVKIKTNAARLTDMVGELLDALTFQGDAALTLRPSLFDARELVDEVLDQYVHGANWTVKFEAAGESVKGYWCRDALRRVLENLVNNAIKYGDGRRVQLTARENRNRLILSVSNTGNPIPEEQRERIFDYLRRDNNVSAVPGWGIGLQFVKAVAEGHGGDVSIDSAPERGTTFFVQLPIDSRPHIDGSAALIA